MKSRINTINNLISYAFYALFALTPLIIFKNTYEIFEFNKMWFVFGLSLIIFFLWGMKMILTRTIEIKRTPLDLFLLLFLLSQIIATIFSIDPYVSWWGYYSRFNGGLLSTITYIFLFFALTTHLSTHEDKKLNVKILLASLFGGILVALWGLPSHFGYDPTCLLFGRGISTNCWTEAFQPTVRIFSTLGQPNWLAAYLAALIPISIAGAGLVSKKNSAEIPFLDEITKNKKHYLQIIFTLTTILFYIDLLFTRSKSGFGGYWIGIAVFIILYFAPSIIKNGFGMKKITQHPARQTIGFLIITTFLLTFIIGIPIKRLESFTLQGILERTQAQEQNETNDIESVQNPTTTDALGGTDSGKIRLIVWRGAIDIFRANPIFGTGPETFAYAYYQYRPQEQNLTSEWDYLYNKAHNEYLNYAATSGVLGIGTYMLAIGAFLTSAFNYAWKKRDEYKLLALALVGGYTSILISNFFGFSVVNTNLLFFLMPALFYSFLQPTKYNFLTLLRSKEDNTFNALQTILIIFLCLIVLFSGAKLLRIWIADNSFAYGNNLNNVNEYVQAYEYLQAAVEIRPQEPLYKNEFSNNLATLALASQMQEATAQAKQFANQSEQLSDEITTNHPQNVVFLKTRIRTMYTLSEIDDRYLDKTFATIEKTKALAPTDAKISYSAAVLYGQSQMYEKALDELNITTTLKPDYRDAYYAKALIATQAAEENPEKVQNYHQIAKDALTHILDNINPEDRQAQELLNSIQ